MPMGKCSACGKFLSAKGGATCSNSACRNRYHLACLLLPDRTQVSADWVCPECKNKLPRTDNSATPVKDLGSGPPIIPAAATVVSSGAVQGAMIRSPPIAVTQAQGTLAKPPNVAGTDGEPSPDTQLTLREEIRLFRSELREVRDEMREFRQEMSVLHSSMGVCTERVDSLEARIEALERRQSATVPDGKVSQLEQVVLQLQLELNDREQDLLGSDLEIANIPEIHGENVLHTVGLVAAKLGVSLDERDIVFAQRVGLRVEREVQVGGVSPVGAAAARARGRRIVVRLARRALRDDLLQSARVRRGATTADMGLPAPPRRFFLNERLTKTNKHLFYRVREAGSRLGWRYTWTKFGRILAKQGDGKPTHCIRSEEDFARVFGGEEHVDKDV